MLFAILITGGVFIAIAYVLTESNAKYLLSGYNTLSEEKQKEFNIKAFLPFFRSFHIFLGISTIVFGLALKFLISDFASGVLVLLYPLSAYIYFIYRSNKYYLKKPPISSKIGIVFLGFIVIFLAIMLFSGIG